MRNLRLSIWSGKIGVSHESLYNGRGSVEGLGKEACSREDCNEPPGCADKCKRLRAGVGRIKDGPGLNDVMRKSRMKPRRRAQALTKSVTEGQDMTGVVESPLSQHQALASCGKPVLESGKACTQDLGPVKLSLKLRPRKKYQTFFCEECGQSFTGKRDLTRHLKSHAPAPNHKEIVLGSALKKYDIQDHRTIPLKPEMYKVNKSGDENTSAMPNKSSKKRQNSLKIFIQKQNGKDTKKSFKAKFVEDTSNLQDKTEGNSEEGLNTEEPKVPQTRTCPLCEQTFARAANLKLHMRLHRGEKPFSCEVCAKTFSRLDHLKKHRSKHDQEKPYSCDLCSEHFKRADHLRYHKINKHDGNIYLNELKSYKRLDKECVEKTILCDICGNSYTDERALKNHMKIHLGRALYACQFCGKSFNQSSNLNVHLRQHTGIKPYKCATCEQAFSTSAKLKTHARKHTGELPFGCEVCGRLFGENHLLKMHMRIHKDEKAFACKHCDKAFTHSSTLRAHIRTHTGAKPYKCQECGDAFAQISSLNYHRRTHTGEKPYSCHICGNAYTRMTTLNIHLSRHSGQKRVSCPHCDFKCDTPKILRKHLETAHVDLQDKDNPWLNLHRKPADALYSTTVINVGSFIGVSLNVEGGQQSVEDLDVMSSVWHTVPQRMMRSDEQVLTSEGTSASDAPVLSYAQAFYPVLNNAVSQSENNTTERSYNLQFPRLVEHTAYKHNSNNECPIKHELCSGEDGTVSDLSGMNNSDQRQSSADVQPSPAVSIERHGGSQSSLSTRETSGDKDVLDNSIVSENLEPLQCDTSLGGRDFADVACHDESTVNAREHTGLTPPVRSDKPEENDLSPSSCGQSCSDHNCPDVITAKKEVERTCSSQEGDDSDKLRGNAQKDNEPEGEIDEAQNYPLEDKITGDVTLVEKKLYNVEKRLKCEPLLLKLKRGKSSPEKAVRQARKQSRSKLGLTKGQSQSKKSKRKTVQPIQCGTCGQTFSRAGNLTTHMRLHTGERPFSCPHCSKTFTRSDHLKSHVALHAVGSQGYTCFHCGQNFTALDLLSSHLHENHEGKKPFLCNTCSDFSCMNLIDLKNHMKSHEDMDCFPCDVCGVTFSKAKEAKRHMAEHAGANSFLCKHCGRAFRESSALRLHVMTKHTGQKPFGCGVCGEGFVTAAKLQRHMRKHTGDRPFACEFCGKLFLDPGLLKMHARIHTNDRPFKCSDCGKCFTHRSTLRAHLRTHTGSKPYTCDVCGNSFAQISSLTYHRRGHEGLKPYTCHICGNSYTRSTTLNVHLSRHTGQRRVSCGQCSYNCDTFKLLAKHRLKAHGPPPASSQTPDQPKPSPAARLPHTALVQPEQMLLFPQPQLSGSGNLQHQLLHSQPFQQQQQQQQQEQQQQQQQQCTPRLPLSVHQLVLSGVHSLGHVDLSNDLTGSGSNENAVSY